MERVKRYQLKVWFWYYHKLYMETRKYKKNEPDINEEFKTRIEAESFIDASDTSIAFAVLYDYVSGKRHVLLDNLN